MWIISYPILHIDQLVIHFLTWKSTLRISLITEKLRVRIKKLLEYLFWILKLQLAWLRIRIGIGIKIGIRIEIGIGVGIKTGLATSSNYDVFFYT